MTRRRLPNRRPSESFNFHCGNFQYIATVSFFESGEPAELFVNNGKCGSDSDVAAKDAAVVASIALQHGVPLETIRRALLRDPRDMPASPLGVALDCIARELDT